MEIKRKRDLLKAIKIPIAAKRAAISAMGDKADEVLSVSDKFDDVEIVIDYSTKALFIHANGGGVATIRMTTDNIKRLDKLMENL